MLLHGKLLELQVTLGKRDDEMAAIIGLPRTTYSSIKTERHGISLAAAKRIVAAFPELAPYALVLEDGPPRRHAEPTRVPDREQRAVALLKKRGYRVYRPRATSS